MTKKPIEEKELKNYEKACESLKDAFIKSLYSEGAEEILSDDGFWIGGKIGDVFSWFDYFISVGDMANYFKYECTPDQFFDWYDQWLEEEGGINMKHYLKLKE